jgi:hypothetical protein
MDRRRRLRGPTLMSCSVLDRPNVLSHNLKVDPFKAQNPSHALSQPAAIAAVEVFCGAGVRGRRRPGCGPQLRGRPGHPGRSITHRVLPLALPPAEIISWPPDEMVVETALPPKRMYSKPPLEMVVGLVRPPEKTPGRRHL